LKRRTYREFLNNLLDKCGPHAVLLCATALGQAKVVDMTISNRNELLETLKANQDKELINNETIQSLTSENLKSIIHIERRGRGDDQHSATFQQQQRIFDDNPTEPKEMVFQNASPQGIAKVFAEKMCRSIQQVTLHGELKAAVTMVFPNRGLVNCLMSLEVGKRSVKWLAMALFGVQVSWENDVLQVICGETLIIPTSEITLKGALGEAVDQILLPGLNIAVTASGISMAIMRNGAIINLALGHSEAIELYQRLYA